MLGISYTLAICFGFDELGAFFLLDSCYIAWNYIQFSLVVSLNLLNVLEELASFISIVKEVKGVWCQVKEQMFKVVNISDKILNTTLFTELSN